MKIKKPLRVVFDCSNGTTGPVLKRVLRNYPPLTAYYINDKPDGNFPAHSPNPVEHGAMKQLRREVLKKGADAGVIFDGDGDRVLLIDNRGKPMPVPPYPLAHLLFSRHTPPFIAEIFTFKALEYLGLSDKNTYPSRVGTLFVKRLMRKKSASVGVEYGGHYFFKDFFYSDSGILAVIKILNALSEMPYSLADLHDLSPNLFSEQFNIYHPSPPSLIKKLESRYNNRARRVQKIDGLAFDFDDWFFVVRPSNTEPLVRFFVGSKDKSIFKREAKKLKSLTRR